MIKIKNCKKTKREKTVRSTLMQTVKYKVQRKKNNRKLSMSVCMRSRRCPRMIGSNIKVITTNNFVSLSQRKINIIDQFRLNSSKLFCLSVSVFFFIVSFFYFNWNISFSLHLQASKRMIFVRGFFVSYAISSSMTSKENVSRNSILRIIKINIKNEFPFFFRCN